MQNEIIIPFQYDEIFTKTLVPDETWYGKKAFLTHPQRNLRGFLTKIRANHKYNIMK